MAHERFFYTQHIDNDILFFEDDEHFHLSRVLRKKSGDTVWAIDGKGSTFETRIELIDKNKSSARIIRRYPAFGEPRNRISLAAGVIKSAHWDILLEKAVELGVYAIFPLNTHYTVKSGIKRERSEKIILSAVKQCGRSRIPELHPVTDFSEFIRRNRGNSVFICDNQDDHPLLEPDDNTSDHLVLIGPEGGFHPDEIRLALDAGAKPVLLANRRLRTETACMLALSRLVI
ncbi:MAG: RsmE family RNA methyltransferase [Candidatus Marinimicrobia bacterium]|nr:RsmE family RNA methyltransferase [Candidatus Neomarinimicrobiota bacterium]